MDLSNACEQCYRCYWFTLNCDEAPTCYGAQEPCEWFEEDVKDEINAENETM